MMKKPVEYKIASTLIQHYRIGGGGGGGGSGGHVA